MTERIPYAPPANPAPLSVAGGEASLGDIVGASFRQMQLVENTTASQVALENAYNARTAAIKAATGIDLGNPLIAELTPEVYQAFQKKRPGAGFDDLGWMGEAISQQRQTYDDKLQELKNLFPEHAGVINAATPIARDAENMAHQADTDLGRLMQSRPGWDSFAASFAGGMGGAMTDPLTVGSLFVGGGAGAAKTVAGRILNTAFREALLNGATEAAAQPFVQDWRKRAGLPNGFDEAARNVLFAATLGGVIGGGGRGAYELLASRARGALSPRAAEALDGNPAAQAELLGDIRDTLPAEARGALDMLEIEAATQRPLADPVAAAVARNEQLATRASLHAQNPALAREMLEPLPLDEDQVARVVGGFATDLEAVASQRGAQPAGAAEGPSGAIRPMTQFLKSIGGIEPGSPLALELNARGIDSRSAPGLFRKEGRPALDNIPFDELPGELRATMRPEEGTVYARQQEFIDQIEAEARPDRQAPRQLDDEAEAQLLDIDARVRRVLGSRPGSDDAFVRQAVQLMSDEGLELDAAIGRLEADLAGTRKTLPEGRFDDLPAEPEDLASLEAQLRGEAGEAGDEIDLKALEEAGFTGDSLLPWGNGAISLEALQKELDEAAWLESVVSACKVA